MVKTVGGIVHQHGQGEHMKDTEHYLHSDPNVPDTCLQRVYHNEWHIHGHVLKQRQKR